MKYLTIYSIGASALITSLSLTHNLPLLADLPKHKAVISLSSQRQPQFHFYLKAEKKVMQLNHPSRYRITWQSLQGDALVHRGDVIRYIVSGKNNSDRSVKYLVVTQPIPKQTTYILNSVTNKNSEAKITYSIDNGKTFVEKPTVQARLANGKVNTRSAPAALYTHLRWNYNKLIGPATGVNATFQVQVR